MRISNNTSVNFKNNTSLFSCFSTVQNQNMEAYLTNINPKLNHTIKQDTVKARALGKISPDILNYDSSEIINTAIGAFGITYLPYLLIKKVPQKENWSKFNTNLLKVGIPLCAYVLADSLSYIFKGKRLFESLKKDKTK